ncbi:aldehyde dehydrogenase (NAD+) [Pseudonocardia ammonioxydans]|uniref:Aldehyde dehydrogenase (NAD+) n=1 Tax=Pseudonocardia ammonioxydans TaxID=260086 RepID=A0A1I4YBI3_PSUAM|nr:aldehyde dehydrogenase family protein [Pseudonocardia ammonioxydans]SFN35388.1 aldehyde dehydrogenase (NAD+) [Pseudonocardia ammonioxydans]
MHPAPTLPGEDVRATESWTTDPARPSRSVSRFRPATAVDARAAVDRAAATGWADTTPARRAAVLGGIAEQLEADRDELADLITREEGKPLGAARGEVGKAAEQFRLAAQLAFLVEGTTYPSETPGTFAYTLRGPLGVVAAVTPWNFPLSLAARKIAPALAAGNAVVFKPSPVTAGTGERLAAAATAAGLPDDAMPVLHGHDPQAMTTLLADPRVRGISFTGSDQVGAAIRAQAHGQARLQLELGGRNCAVVCADADLERAATDIVTGAFGLTGQACTSTDRVLVARPVAAELMGLLAERVRALTVGPGDDPATTTGPVATAGQFRRLEALRASAVEAGARIVASAGAVTDRDPDGFWVPPTLFTEVPTGHPLVTDEVFGPFCTVLPVAGVDEALAVLDDSTHGLATAVHTTDLAVAHRFAATAPCGIVKINGPTTGNGVAPPFGGLRASSGGGFPEGGRQALDFVTDVRTVYLTP